MGDNKKKRGRPEWVPSEQDIKMMESMAAVGITLDQIASVFGVVRETIRKKVGDRLESARVKAVSSIGGALYRKAMSGNLTAMIFYLKTQGGWSEKNHVELSGNLPIVVNVNKKSGSAAS